MPVKSFRLSKEQSDAYDKVLDKLDIEGDSESEKFRNLITFLTNYFESEPMLPMSFEDNEPSKSLNPTRVDLFELLMRALREHENSLELLVKRLEKAQPATN